MEKKNSYDKWWLSSDMENMAYIFEYCDKYCREIYGVEIDKQKFLNQFMVSNIRFEMETGHPMLLSESARDTVERFVDADNHGNIKQFIGDGRSEYSYCKDQLYWVGMTYAYIHFKFDILSRELIKNLPLKQMLQDYYLGHEMDIEVYCDKIKDRLGKHKE